MHASTSSRARTSAAAACSSSAATSRPKSTSSARSPACETCIRLVRHANVSRMNDEHESFLAEIARQAMIDRGLQPDYPPDALKQLETIGGPANEKVRDMRELPWCSIDNDDSRDLD